MSGLGWQQVSSPLNYEGWTIAHIVVSSLLFEHTKCNIHVSKDPGLHFNIL